MRAVHLVASVVCAATAACGLVTDLSGFTGGGGPDAGGPDAGGPPDVAALDGAADSADTDGGSDADANAAFDAPGDSAADAAPEAAPHPEDAGDGATVTPPAYVQRAGSATKTGSDFKAASIPLAGVRAGDLLVVAVVLGNAGSSGTLAATDPSGNAYSLAFSQVNTGNDLTAVVYAWAAHPPTRIDLTFPASGDFRATADEFSGITRFGGAAKATATGGQFDSGGVVVTTLPTLLFGVIANQSGSPSAWSNGWTPLAQIQLGTDYLLPGYQIASLQGIVSATGSTSGEWTAGLLSFE